MLCGKLASDKVAAKRNNREDRSQSLLCGKLASDASEAIDYHLAKKVAILVVW